jgi:hypothetical protein
MISRTHCTAIVLVAEIGSSTFTTRPVSDRGDGLGADDQIDVGGDLSTLNRFVFLDPSWAVGVHPHLEACGESYRSPGLCGGRSDQCLACGACAHAAFWRGSASLTSERSTAAVQGWRTFVHSHADVIASIDMFVVPAISFGLLYELLILRQSRRELLSLGVTAHPNAEGLARQLTAACGRDEL